MFTSAASAQEYTFTATHYGESYNGQSLGCAGHGNYSSSDSSIVAIGPNYTAIWPCGTELSITGPAGTITGIRRDFCPGCNRMVAQPMIDLSEAGIIAVCGGLGSCTVRVEER